MNDPKVSEANLVGGSGNDRRRLLQLLDEYIVANADFDWDALQPFWSTLPEATFYNLNGHTYRGADHWRRLWAFYKENVPGSYWTSFDIGGVVTDEMAVVWCHRDSSRRWIGTDQPPREIHYQGDKFITRSTMVFRKEAGDWRVVHAHFSEVDSGPRPGGI